MARQPFTFADIAAECRIETGVHALHGHGAPRSGLRIAVPPALFDRYPYNASAYVWLQQLRASILEHGTVELPGLPLNRTNHTLAQRAPKQHGYSANPYLTGECQHLHQDTPPYPTAFWLAEPRRYFATWVTALPGLALWLDDQRQRPHASLHERHRELVPRSLAEGTGVLLNTEPGLLLIDNSEHCQLYHARTCRFEAVAANPDYTSDAPMYAFNEIGLLQYIDTLDERRGPDDRDASDKADVMAFMAAERW